ncbi:hypothetical protein PHJA_001882000 [Phtheirospermum japonicum]|uniref:Ribosomal RNA-processing protein 17 n=1 Tax=Phtheirospermum japonicum TaxID=374723 RepID=A0A830CED6_9LAMI|nr:hypothetical protein PHJA_001882000 [Phtheirospermum japonicum]
MDEAAAEDGGAGSLHVRAHHIKKRALKNKSLSVSFNEKDLKDYVTGFHKRKKKRRKEAMQQQEEAERRKRIERRKKRKLERDSVYGEAAASDSGMDDDAENDDEHEHDEDAEPVPSVSGTMMYDNGDMQVTVTTSEIAREEEEPIDMPEDGETEGVEASEKSKKKIPVVRKKKLIKRVQKKRPRPKQQSKRDKRKGKTQNKKQL